MIYKYLVDILSIIILPFSIYALKLRTFMRKREVTQQHHGKALTSNHKVLPMDLRFNLFTCIFISYLKFILTF